ncbi:MAG: transposase [Thermoplasmata archaeon]|nr:MAG: transposase [Thermoplasmata archaeon]
MKAIIICKPDIASCNIFENLKSLRNWKEEGEFQGNPLLFYDDFLMATINDEHIFHDNVDIELGKVLKQKPECIIYASRHRSESGKRSLTVHPIGNFGKAEFGGKEKTLIPSSPHLMTEALRILRKKAKDLDFSVSFEATHHGPFLSTPTFFIEIGSDEETWRYKGAGRAIAETILETQTREYEVGIGIGGGHYSPRMTDVAIERKISFGHIVPTYALSNLTPDMARQVISQTQDVKKVHFHKKHLKGEEYRKWKEFFLKIGITPVKSADLELLK